MGNKDKKRDRRNKSTSVKDTKEEGPKNSQVAANISPSEGGTSSEGDIDSKRSGFPKSVTGGHSEEKQKKQGHTLLNKLHPVTDPNITDEQDDNQDIHQHGLIHDKKFSKRKLVSNWDRYDEPIVDETSESFTSDFNYVLSLSSSGGSRFQFSDEKSWSDDVNSSAADFLQLDCTDIATSLACIPLHTRLKIDPTVFNEKTLNNMESIAKQCSNQYAALPPRRANHNTPLSSQQLEANKINAPIIAALLTSDDVTMTEEIHRPIPGQRYDLSEHMQVEEDLGSGEREDDVETVAAVAVTKVVDGPRTVISAGAAVSPHISTGLPIHPSTTATVEDDLDNLLTLTAPVQTFTVPDLNNPKEVTRSSASLPPSLLPPESTESLEDWLDGVLDD